MSALSDRDAVLAAVPRGGRLRNATQVQAFAGKRMSVRTVELILRQLRAEGVVVRREPFSAGRPERWGAS
jgi:hypothetical protein